MKSVAIKIRVPAYLVIDRLYEHIEYDLRVRLRDVELAYHAYDAEALIRDFLAEAL